MVMSNTQVPVLTPSWSAPSVGASVVVLPRDELVDDSVVLVVVSWAPALGEPRSRTAARAVTANARTHRTARA